MKNWWKFFISSVEKILQQNENTKRKTNHTRLLTVNRGHRIYKDNKMKMRETKQQNKTKAKKPH